jgi:hypothetical protein
VDALTQLGLDPDKVPAAVRRNIENQTRQLKPDVQGTKKGGMIALFMQGIDDLDAGKAPEEVVAAMGELWKKPEQSRTVTIRQPAGGRVSTNGTVPRRGAPNELASALGVSDDVLAAGEAAIRDLRMGGV